MSIVLCRVDERLVHGQVVIGWGSRMRPDRYAIVDDDLADAEWEQELYRLCLTDGTEAEFLSSDAAAARIREWTEAPERTIVLLRGLDTAVDLARIGALEGLPLNLGGVHHAPGRREVLPFLHLDEDDVDRIRWLGEHGVELEAQELPDAPRWSGSDLVEKGGRLWKD